MLPDDVMPETNALPPQAWPCCDPETLPALLAEKRWSLVEFWAPDVIYGRLLAPHRASFRRDCPAGLGLHLCHLETWSEASAARCAPFGVTALPAILLFHETAVVRRWSGVSDVSLIRHHVCGRMSPHSPPACR